MCMNVICTLLQEVLYILMYICMYHTYVGVHISSQYLRIHIMYTSACLVSVLGIGLGDIENIHFDILSFKLSRYEYIFI